MSSNRKRKERSSTPAAPPHKRSKATVYIHARSYWHCKRWITTSASMVLQQQVLNLIGSVLEHPKRRLRNTWVTSWTILFAGWRRLPNDKRNAVETRFIDAVEIVKNQTTPAARDARVDRRAATAATLNADHMLLQRAHNLVSSGRPIRLGCFVVPFRTISLDDVDPQARSRRMFPLSYDDNHGLSRTVPDAFCWARCTEPPASTLSITSHTLHQTVVSKGDARVVLELLEDCHYCMPMPSHLFKKDSSVSSPSLPASVESPVNVDDSTLLLDPVAVERTECVERHLNGSFQSRMPSKRPFGFRSMHISNYSSDPRPGVHAPPHHTCEMHSSTASTPVYRKIHRSTAMEMSNVVYAWPSREITLPLDTWCCSLVEITPMRVLDGRCVYGVQQLMIRVMWQETALYYAMLDAFDTSVIPVVDLPRELWTLMVDYAFPSVADNHPALRPPSSDVLNPPLRTAIPT